MLFDIYLSKNTRDSAYFGYEECSIWTPERALAAFDNKGYELAGRIEAESLEGAFVVTQNMQEPWNPGSPCRSTMIGDIFVDFENQKVWCVSAGEFGFEELRKFGQITIRFTPEQQAYLDGR